MKRLLANTLKILLFIIGFACAVWYFMPWGEAGKFIMSAAHSQLERMGMRVSYSDISGEADGFTVHNLALNGMANFKFSSITLRPRPAVSLLSLALVCDISFKGGSAQLGQVINLGDGGVTVTAWRSEIMLENLHTNGEFGLNGWMTIDRQAMRIARADARLSVPDTFAQNMGLLRNFLPVVQEGDRWYLRRN